jgi:hypothetical protein
MCSRDKADEIEPLSKKGFSLKEVNDGLPQIIADITLLRSSPQSNVPVMGIKSLQTFKPLLGQSHEQLDSWRNTFAWVQPATGKHAGRDQGLHEKDLFRSFQPDSPFISFIPQNSTR